MYLTKDHFKYLLSSVLEHLYEGEKDSIFGIIGAGENMKYDLVTHFYWEPGRIVFQAHANDFVLKDKRTADVLFFVNKWNTEYLNQSCYYDEENSSLVMSGALFTDVHISDEYIVENFIRFYISSAIRLFSEAENKFSNETGKH